MSGWIPAHLGSQRGVELAFGDVQNWWVLLTLNLLWEITQVSLSCCYSLHELSGTSGFMGFPWSVLASSAYFWTLLPAASCFEPVRSPLHILGILGRFVAPHLDSFLREVYPPLHAVRSVFAGFLRLSVFYCPGPHPALAASRRVFAYDSLSPRSTTVLAWQPNIPDPSPPTPHAVFSPYRTLLCHTPPKVKSVTNGDCQSSFKWLIWNHEYPMHATAEREGLFCYPLRSSRILGFASCVRPQYGLKYPTAYSATTWN